jgi:HD-GYP domain-containing protein (c-di-GMP phosphodiesterase class II)
MLLAWSRVLDMRDHVTDEHTQRAADLTVTLARRMGVPENRTGHIRRGALLHDIGKMGIPDAILQKPFTLTDEELVVMQSHPVLAYRLLYADQLSCPCRGYPLLSPRKWDGTGYPRGLKGRKFPWQRASLPWWMSMMP